MVIKTEDVEAIKPFLKKLYIPPKGSHKGQNGKVLVIGGSSLFHSASIWGAEIASYFVDLVHYSSTAENNEVIKTAKKKFKNGIVVPKKELLHYVKEDDSILVGLGMVRGKIKQRIGDLSFEELLRIEDEPTYTAALTEFLIQNFPNKKFVFDAGALQMMDKEWLLKLKTKPVITPHVGEFEKLFGEKINNLNDKDTEKVVAEKAKQFKCIILLKKVSIFISDGKESFVVEGGNAGLTKGGTGDITAGLTAALYAKNDALTSAILAGFLLKKTAERLFLKRRYWYNIGNLVDNLPETLSEALQESHL